MGCKLSPGVERKILKHSLRYYCLTKVVGKEKETTRKEKGKEMHPLEAETAQFYCSLASYLIGIFFYSWELGICWKLKPGGFWLFVEHA